MEYFTTCLLLYKLWHCCDKKQCNSIFNIKGSSPFLVQPLSKCNLNIKQYIILIVTKYKLIFFSKY